MTEPSSTSHVAFRVDENVRRQRAVRRTLLGLLAIFGGSILFQVVRGVPIWPPSYGSLVALILLPALFFARSRWGDKLVFDTASLRIFRGDALKKTIPLKAIQKVKFGDDAFTITWTDSGLNKHQLVSKEGFSDDDWSIITSLVDPEKNA